MRPSSIIMFERLFLASLVVSAVNFFVGYDAMLASVEREPSLRALGVGQGFAVGSFVVGIAIYLLLWFFIARKASNVAKWIFVVLLALSVLSVLYTLAASFALTVTTLLGLAIYALEISAAVFLFRDDAVAWLTHKEPTADPATFD